MPRRRPALALLALATLLGAGGSATATAEATAEAMGVGTDERGGSGPRARPVPARAAASDDSVTGLAASQPETTPRHELDDDTGEPDDDAAEPDDDAAAWRVRIEQRLAAVHEAGLAHAARRFGPEAHASPSLVRRLDALAARLHDPALLGIAVLDLDTGAPVFAHHAGRGLNPASNHKLVTAAAALELLGEDYRWQTRVLRAGDALVLRGEGDPSLRVEHLERLVAEVAAALDLREIRRVIVDDTAFSPRRFGPGYDPEGAGVSYMAPSGALSVQWNTVEVHVRGAAAGQAVPVRVSPASAHVKVRSTATGGRGALDVRSAAEGDRTVIAVRGHLARGSRVTVRRRVADPGRFTGSAFAAMLARHGAAGPDGAGVVVELGPTPAGATPVATHQSAPLSRVLDGTLHWSSNFSTEQILRTLGWRMSGEPGDWDNGGRALARYWEAAGLGHHALAFENGSGLSRHGRISAAALTELLAFAAREGSSAAALGSALPVAGRQGTVRGRLRRSGGRVRAKTGTLSGASALSGVVQARGGRRLGFSILVNGPVPLDRSRRLQDAVVMALLDHGAAR
jgi:serine-type D-Ala-D-Ala carboxypeptidase/endopeptidase (penicillin-binding protein 4)